MARLPRRDQFRILDALAAIAQDPRPPGCRAVKHAPRGTYRVRVGDFRIIYTVLDQDEVIVVARRDESTYRGLE
jgi:mRNA interferase RelE/StbE